jgi:hypothetical protein
MGEVSMDITIKLSLSRKEFRLVGLALASKPLRAEEVEEAKMLNARLQRQVAAATHEIASVYGGAAEAAESSTTTPAPPASAVRRTPRKKSDDGGVL